MGELQRLYTKDDYTRTNAPYEELYKIRDDPFEHQRKLDAMSEAARLTGYKTFKKTYEAYVKSLRQMSSAIWIGSITEFEGQPLELDSGAWRADEMGVTMRSGFEDLVACVHPILPVERLVNVDTGTEKLDIAFRKGKQWRHVIVEKRILASANAIIALADNGIAVTSESAKYLVKYLHDLENLNYDAIPESASVSRLGYIDGEGFSPYVDGLIFDGDANFRTTFRSVRSEGKRDEWLRVIRTARSDSVTAKIIIAASFASALVQPLGALPFFVHLWGATAGIGKTVALMAAASVWADPSMGRYIQTFNSTTVGHEMFAAFLNSLPLIIDEMQLARDEKGRSKFSVYQLAEGVGRTRGSKVGGVQKTPTWGNCIITSGETPLTTDSAGAGAKNRVIEIECTEKVIMDGHSISSALKRHFGFAGREFVERLADAGERPLELYRETFKTLSDSDTTEKQAMAAALIITADTLAAEWIIGDQPLTVADIARFLQTNAGVDVNERAYAYMCDWVSLNVNKLRGGRDGSENYGVIEDSHAFVNSTVFRTAVDAAGYSSTALLGWLRRKGLLLLKDSRPGFTTIKSVGGTKSAYVAMQIATDEIPF